MSVEQEQEWITGEELRLERRRLIEAGVLDEAPEFQELWHRVDARDDYLFERYGKPFMETHHGKWIAISLDGRTVIGDTASGLGRPAREAFGGGNFAMRKLAEFPGHQMGL